MNKNLFQECELEAYLGDCLGDYDVAGIIADATYVDYEDGNRYWLDDVDLGEICERNER